MDKRPLLMVSLCAVVLLVLGSFTNCLRVETVQGCVCDDPLCWPELSGKMGDNNWYVSVVTVKFNGTFNYLYYRIDGNDWINYSQSFTLETQGIHLLEWTCDSNMSNISSLEIKMDWSSPNLTNYTIKRIGLIKWKFGVNATDEFSGVNRVKCPFSHYPDTEPPYQFIWWGFYFLFLLRDLIDIYFYTWNAWDNAGNSIDQPSNILGIHLSVLTVLVG